ncbi:hypothetical protein ARMGADRAFT_1019101 [Armillaria gallica]|uniref:Uncharacterized protein n=1 Tax=Armillaria gallica TaxID=47427 RepID=A0A2H3D5E5_ARMGA|nr:hypothetical protein ARMGADRAFT_1019101 [Armillaria gallica]
MCRMRCNGHWVVETSPFPTLTSISSAIRRARLSVLPCLAPSSISGIILLHGLHTFGFRRLYYAEANERPLLDSARGTFPTCILALDEFGEAGPCCIAKGVIVVAWSVQGKGCGQLG